MRVYALVIKPSYAIVRQALGVEPDTSPPVTLANFNPAAMCQAEIIYIKLHGLPQIPHRWFGEDDEGALMPALGAEYIRTLQLNNPVVILANCYGGSSPMVEDFYHAGAQAIIAGSGPNYAGKTTVTGIDLLAAKTIYHIQRGVNLTLALLRAKAEMLMTGHFDTASIDALEFQIMENKK